MGYVFMLLKEHTGVRVLITGVTGFVGGYLATVLAQNADLILYGVARNPAKLLPELRSRITCFSGDLTSPTLVQEVLQETKPAMIYHLAGQASVPTAWSDPWQTFQANVLPQLNLLQNLVDLGLEAQFLSVTSSKVYGSVSETQLPIGEDTPLCPDSPYGVSKASQDLMALQYYLSHQLPIIRARPFNHIGPRQGANFVTASFARQIALAEAGKLSPVVRVGNLSVQRDFTDVQDVVRAYVLLVARGRAGEAYNIGSGRAVTVQYILDVLLSLSTIKITVEEDPARMRLSDQPVSYGDISKIRRETGWQPEIHLEESLRQILNYWRQQVAIEKTAVEPELGCA